MLSFWIAYRSSLRQKLLSTPDSLGDEGHSHLVALCLYAHQKLAETDAERARSILRHWIQLGLPQAAIGAVMRAKRCMIVGDPLQIPPVASLPERLNAEICTYFKVSTSLWAAPNILNVAVSRAKQNLYVVGSHAAWSGIGHARELGHPSALPKKCLLTA